MAYEQYSKENDEFWEKERHIKVILELYNMNSIRLENFLLPLHAIIKSY